MKTNLQMWALTSFKEKWGGVVGLKYVKWQEIFFKRFIDFGESQKIWVVFCVYQIEWFIILPWLPSRYAIDSEFSIGSLSYEVLVWVLVALTHTVLYKSQPPFYWEHFWLGFSDRQAEESHVLCQVGPESFPIS